MGKNLCCNLFYTNYKGIENKLNITPLYLPVCVKLLNRIHKYILNAVHEYIILTLNSWAERPHQLQHWTVTIIPSMFFFSACCIGSVWWKGHWIMLLCNVFYMLMLLKDVNKRRAEQQIRHSIAIQRRKQIQPIMRACIPIVYAMNTTIYIMMHAYIFCVCDAGAFLCVIEIIYTFLNVTDILYHLQIFSKVQN